MRVSPQKIKFVSILALIAAMAMTAMAQNPYRVADRQVRDLISRIESETNAFRADAQRSIDRSIWNGTNREASMDSLLNSFETSTDQLSNNFNGRRSAASDVQEVLNRAAAVDRLMRNNSFPARVESEWTQIRSDLDTLASYYTVRSTG